SSVESSRRRQAVDDVRADPRLAIFMQRGSTMSATELLEFAIDRLAVSTSGQRVRRTFMFTDLVGSTQLLAAMGDQQWATVLHWHDRTIRDLLRRHGGLEVKQRHGGDGF